jgi:hypothetical protein
MSRKRRQETCNYICDEGWLVALKWTCLVIVMYECNLITTVVEKTVTPYLKLHVMFTECLIGWIRINRQTDSQIYIFTKKIMFLREVHCSNLGWDTECFCWNFRRFPRYLQTNATVVLWKKHGSFLRHQLQPLFITTSFEVTGVSVADTVST